MIGDALRTDIESFAARKRNNPVFFMAENGTLTSEMVRRYIACVHYMISLTPAHMTRARERALTLGDEKLADHFAHKLEEELGHDVWSERDLESLTRLAAATTSAEVAPSAKRLGAYIERIIDEDPALYLSYIAFAEYMTVMLAPEWLALIEERCGIPRAALTVIDNHVELDRDHAEEAFALMDDLVGDPRKLGRMRKALADAIALFEGYCAEVTAEDHSDEPVSRDGNVSAA